MEARVRLLLSAVISGVLFGAGYFVVAVIPGGGDVTDKDFTDFYDSDGKMLAALILFFVLTAGCFSLLWFFNELRERLADSPLTRTAYAAAAVGAAAVATGAGILGGPLGAQQNSDSGFVGVPIAETFAQAGLGVMLVVGMYALAVATVLVSVAARKNAALPSWLSIAGIVAGVIMLGSYIWLPGLIFPVWVIVVGVVASRQRAG
jgi:hypothetical protein